MPTRAVTNRPTHLTLWSVEREASFSRPCHFQKTESQAHLATHPIEIPVKAKKTHHSSSNGLLSGKRSACPSANPCRRSSPALLVVEAREEVDGGKGEEEEHRVEEYEATNDEPGEICVEGKISSAFAYLGSSGKRRLTAKCHQRNDML